MKAKKSLGQNFLTSKKVTQDIVNAGDIKPDDVILEIGPGRGFLTEELIKKAGKVIAVEKDWELVEFLREKFKGVKNLEIIQQDILKFDFNCPSGYTLVANNYKIIANIPYYITSHLLRKFLESDFQPKLMVLMLQKEVAERIALDKKQSILSISVKVYGEPKIIREVSAENFSPKPKVDSAILLIDNISKSFFREGPTFARIEEGRFFSVVKQGFSSKRKTLKNNLKLLEAELLTECGVGEKERAENLSLENWRCLCEKLDTIKE